MPATLNDFDLAAEKAKHELQTIKDAGGATTSDIAAWWKRWYMSAGHKRLGRILIKFA